jgi:hypothetical protein
MIAPIPIPAFASAFKAPWFTSTGVAEGLADGDVEVEVLEAVDEVKWLKSSDDVDTEDVVLGANPEDVVLNVVVDPAQ